MRPLPGNGRTSRCAATLVMLIGARQQMAEALTKSPQEIVEKLMPEGFRFGSLREMQALCRELAATASIRLQATVPIDDASNLRNITSECPPFALQLLLEDVEACLESSLSEAYLERATYLHYVYGILKAALASIFGEHWAGLLAGWRLEELEWRVHKLFQEQLSESLNTAEAQVSRVPQDLVGRWSIHWRDEDLPPFFLDIFNDGWVEASPSTGPGGARLEATMGKWQALGWPWALEGHAETDWDLVRMVQGTLQLRRRSGTAWRLGEGSRLGVVRQTAFDSFAFGQHTERSAPQFDEVCPRSFPRIEGKFEIVASGFGEARGGGRSKGLAAKVMGPLPQVMAMIGNSMSLYWQARGVAWLAGTTFQAQGASPQSPFLKNLPRLQHRPHVPQVEVLKSSCRDCSRREDWRWPHLCLGAWSHILPMVRATIASALLASGLEEKVESLLGPFDVVIHFRCLPFFSSEYPLPGFSFLLTIPEPFRSSPALRIWIVAGTLGAVCFKVLEAMERYLKSQYPQAELIRKVLAMSEGGMAEDLGDEEAVETDFALLVAAPLLLKASASSFSLWAALGRLGKSRNSFFSEEDGEEAVAETEGELRQRAREKRGNGSRPRVASVISVHNPTSSESAWRWSTADFGPSWHWAEVPLLTKAVGNQLGFHFEDSAPWIKWLSEH